jgi:lipid II:glycine glycyltransferase (peptidoglycan interpeptide bridge formation enzyme)
VDAACARGEYQDVSRLYEMADNRKLVLPLVRKKGVPEFLATAGTMPSGWGMGGLLSKDPVRTEDVAAVFDDLATLPFASVGIRPNPRAGELWASAAPANVMKVQRYSHVLDLTPGYDAIWSKGFSTLTRRKVRAAQKNGVVIERDTTGKFASVFHHLYMLSIDRWAEQANEPLPLARMRARSRDPLAKFESIAKTLGEACHIWVATIDGVPAASTIVLQFGNANYSRNAMDKELAGRSGANDLILNTAIQEACEAGCRYFHLGESGSSSGLDEFKSRFGAVGVPYAEYYRERLPIMSANKRVRGIVKKLINFKE